jgi:hypothetical protein
LIYDSKNQKWRKFNDSIITEITEEEVYRLAIGIINGLFRLWFKVAKELLVHIVFSMFKKAAMSLTLSPKAWKN